MRATIAIPCLAALACAGATAHAAPVLRVQVNQPGDFLLVGNTLGYDCDTGTPAPVVGTLAADACMQSTADLDDSSPDVYWSADDPAAGECLADTTTPVSQARSTAVLAVPPGATVTHAFLYWSANNTTNVVGGPVTLERVGAGGFGPTTITALQSWLPGTDDAYQSVADITALVQQNGSGAYRVSGISVAPFVDVDVDVLYGGWALVAFYNLPGDAVRNLALFDGLDVVKTGQNSAATLTGFLVPNAGFDGKLGVVAWEGDNQATGDSLSFNGVKLSNALNPVDNFFNSTRSWLGVGSYAVGDLPQLTGGPQSTAGVDIDVVDITAELTMGQSSAPILATTGGDTYYLGAFITSISTLAQDFSTSTKTASSSGVILPGSVVTYTITATNTGNDASAGTFVTDPLPSQVTYVPGSIAINGVSQTDVAGDDEAEYTAGTRTVTARLGTGATAAAGGSLAVGASATVTFRVTVNGGVLGQVSNQGTITAGGSKGAPVTTYVTENGTVAGSPTVITVNQCGTNANCAAPTPVCDTAVSPSVCVGCLQDSDCGGTMSGIVCNGVTDTCEPGCRGMGGNGCPTGDTCSSMNTTIGTCIPSATTTSSSSGTISGSSGMTSTSSGMTSTSSGTTSTSSGMTSTSSGMTSTSSGMTSTSSGRRAPV